MVYNRKEKWELPNKKDEDFRYNQLRLKGHEIAAIEAIMSDEIAKGILIKHINHDRESHTMFDKMQQRRPTAEPIDMKWHNKSVENMKALKKRFPNA
jgi:hypothetical protein